MGCGKQLIMALMRLSTLFSTIAIGVIQNGTGKVDGINPFLVAILACYYTGDVILFIGICWKRKIFLRTRIHLGVVYFKVLTTSGLGPLSLIYHQDIKTVLVRYILTAIVLVFILCVWYTYLVIVYFIYKNNREQIGDEQIEEYLMSVMTKKELLDFKGEKLGWTPKDTRDKHADSENSVQFYNKAIMSGLLSSTDGQENTYS